MACMHLTYSHAMGSALYLLLETDVEVLSGSLTRHLFCDSWCTAQLNAAAVPQLMLAVMCF